MLYVLVVDNIFAPEGATIRWYFDVEGQFEAAKCHAISKGIYKMDYQDYICDAGEFKNWLSRDT